MTIPLTRATVAISLLAVVGLAWGQQYVRQGNALDANLRAGSGGINTARPVYGAGSFSNRVMTGNVSRGMSFQAYTPIRDSNSLFLGGNAPGSIGLGTPSGSGLLSSGSGTGFSGLPSDRLYHFTRDSVSVADARLRDLSRKPQPYYSPSSTVANTGAIVGGLTRPGTSQLISPNTVPNAALRPQSLAPQLPTPEQRAGTALQVRSLIVRANTGEPVKGPVNQRLLASPLFSGVRAVPLDDIAAAADAASGSAGLATGSMDRRVQGGAPIDTRVDQRVDGRGVAGELASPLDRLLPRADQRPTDLTSLLARTIEARSGRMEGMAIAPPADSADVFANMRAVSPSLVRPVGAAETPQARGGQAGLPGGVPSGPVLIRPTDAGSESVSDGQVGGGPSLDRQAAAARAVSAAPLATFVGTEDSVLNKYLAEAERKLRAGEFYEAANVYNLARSVDLDNPLPLVGRSIALLMAGDYMTSATNLFLGIQRFESLALFRIDMARFVPDPALLDRRRIDIEKRLESFEDFRMRFLLGFAEYCSGFGDDPDSARLRELGLANLEKAAEAATEIPQIGRFVELLKQRDTGKPAPVQISPDK